MQRKIELENLDVIARFVKVVPLHVLNQLKQTVTDSVEIDENKKAQILQLIGNK